VPIHSQEYVRIRVGTMILRAHKHFDSGDHPGQPFMNRQALVGHNRPPGIIGVVGSRRIARAVGKMERVIAIGVIGVSTRFKLQLDAGRREMVPLFERIK